MMLAQPPKGDIRVRKSQAKTAALGHCTRKNRNLCRLCLPHMLDKMVQRMCKVFIDWLLQALAFQFQCRWRVSWR